MEAGQGIVSTKVDPPNEYIQEMLNANARRIVNKIQDIFDNEDPDFLASNSNELTNMIEEIIND